MVHIVNGEDLTKDNRLYPQSFAGRDDLTLALFDNPNHPQALMVGLLDNLGKGAAGQAVQNLTIMLGLNQK